MSTLMIEPRTETSPTTPARVRYEPSLLTDHDLYLFNEGTHYRLYDKLGAHCLSHEGVEKLAVGIGHTEWLRPEQHDHTGEQNARIGQQEPVDQPGSSPDGSFFLPLLVALVAAAAVPPTNASCRRCVCVPPASWRCRSPTSAPKSPPIRSTSTWCRFMAARQIPLARMP